MVRFCTLQQTTFLMTTTSQGWADLYAWQPPGEPHAAFAAYLSGTADCRGEGGSWTSMSALYVPAPQIFLNVRFA
jgi:hypothetical protein